MPIDVIFILERAVGKPIVTSTVSKMHGACWSMPNGDAASEVMDLPAAMGELTTFIKAAMLKDSPGGMKFTETEKRRYHELRAHLEKELREVDLAVENDQSLHFPGL